MQRFGALAGVVAMLIALLTSPLYHSHDHDDHGQPASVVHAHFLEAEESEHHPEDELEADHAQGRARWIDFFVFSPPSAAIDLPIDLTETPAVLPVSERYGVVLAAIPNAHGPPGERPSIPRSPPVL